MALCCLYADTKDKENPSGINAVLVDAANEAAARTAAIAALTDPSTPHHPGSGTTVPTNWAYTTLAATAGLPDSRTVVWIEGTMASLIGKTRGGSILEIQ